MRLRVLGVAAGLLLASSEISEAAKAFFTGNELYNQCSNYMPAEALFCQGYVAALSDSLGPEYKVCMPNEVTLGQAMDVVITFLRAHPELRHLTAWSLVQNALAQAFPCK